MDSVNNVNSILLDKYKISNMDNNTKVKLLKNGYRRTVDFENNDIFTYTFPVCKSKKKPTRTILECKLNIYVETGEVSIDVYDYNTGECYHPFYFYNCGNYEPLLNKINKKIYAEFEKVGIKKIT